MKNADKNIPEQVKGEHTDFTNANVYPDKAAARKAFLDTKAKLLNVNNWHEYAGPGSSKFEVTDDKGIVLRKLAEVGDHIRIDLSGAPGPDAGDGFEWVMVERLIEEGDAESVEESVTMILRPTAAPEPDSETIAHFFSDISTNTFIVARYGLEVSAEAHGRNETPNNKGVDVFDTVRNTIIGLTARTGLSGIQWQTLVNGLIDK